MCVLKRRGWGLEKGVPEAGVVFWMLRNERRMVGLDKMDVEIKSKYLTVPFWVCSAIEGYEGGIMDANEAYGEHGVCLAHSGFRW